MRAGVLGLPMLLLAVTTIPAAALASSGGGKVDKGPSGIPFSCSDGRSLRVHYEDHGPRAAAELHFDGGSHLELHPAAAYTGLRYTTGHDTNPATIWATDGVKGWILEAAADGEEREVAACERRGWNGEAIVAEAHHSEHEEAAH